MDTIFDIYEQYGNAGYIGEDVSQIEHALQCARLAQNEGFDDYVVLGSLFHDIGHLLGETSDQSKYPKMIRDGINYGVDKHEKLGADFLRKLNLPEKICYFVEHHVSAKRYLVFKDSAYYEKLSEASKQTLVFQGGPMNEEEAARFESHEMFNALLRLRNWDDLAKDLTLNLASHRSELMQEFKILLSSLMR